MTFVLVPIVIAVALCGFHAGPWLGFVFGIAVLVTGDANAFLAFDPFLTVLVVLLKGTLAGLAAASVYKLLENKTKFLAIILAAIVAPVVNSGVFFIGCMLFFSGLVESWGVAAEGVAVYVVTVMIGINFLIEVAVNLVLVPSIYRVINIKKKV